MRSASPRGVDGGRHPTPPSGEVPSSRVARDDQCEHRSLRADRQRPFFAVADKRLRGAGRPPTKGREGPPKVQPAFVVILWPLMDEDRLGGGLAGIKVEDVKIQSEVAPGSPITTPAVPDRLGRVAVVCIALAASLGLLPWLGESMFADEGATLYSAHLSWANLWAQSQHVDLVLLPYYVLVHFWITLSGNIAWVRALSLFAFFGTVVVIGWTGLRLAGRWCGIISSVLTATSTILVEKSLNARPYELSSFMVVLCAVFLFKWLEDSRARWLWAFSIVGLLATAMQLFSLLAPVSMLFGVLVVRPQLIGQRLRAQFAPIVLLGVVSCAWVVACIGEVGQVNWIANETIGTRLLAEVRGPVVGQVYDFVLIVIAVAVVTKLAVVWNSGGRDAVVGRVSQDREVLGLTFGWAVIPTLILSIVSFVHPIYSVRYVSASAPGVALLAAFVCVRAFPKTLDPTRPSDGSSKQKNANPSGSDRRRGSSRPLGHRLFRIGISTAGRSQRAGTVRSPTLGAGRRHRLTGPCAHLGS